MYCQWPVERFHRLVRFSLRPMEFSRPPESHRTTNAVMSPQWTFTGDITPEFRPSLLMWVHNLLVYAQSISDRLESVRGLFSYARILMSSCNHQNRSIFPGPWSIPWCSRIISSDGMRFSSRRFDDIPHMEIPTTGAQVQQIVYAMQ